MEHCQATSKVLEQRVSEEIALEPKEEGQLVLP